MLRLSYFPDIWRIAVVMLIPKIGKPKNMVISYRPISILLTLGKRFEKYRLKRIRPILSDHSISYRYYLILNSVFDQNILLC